MRHVDPQFYPRVIREMIRQEDDVTNHCLVSLLVVQRLIANAAIAAGREGGEIVPLFAIAASPGANPLT